MAELPNSLRLEGMSKWDYVKLLKGGEPEEGDGGEEAEIEGEEGDSDEELEAENAEEEDCVMTTTWPFTSVLPILMQSSEEGNQSASDASKKSLKFKDSDMEPDN